MAKKQFQNNHESLSSKRLLGAAVSLLIFFLLLMSVIRLAQKYIAIKTRSHELQQEQSTLTAKQQDLATTNAFLASPEGTEQSLRERYDYLKPGEQMIIVSPGPDDMPPPPPKTGIAHWWDELLKGLGLRQD